MPTTTGTTSSEPSTIDQLKRNRRDVGLGLCWAALMLGILAFWHNANPPSLTFVTTIFWFLAGGSVALAAWQLFGRPDNEEVLRSQRKLLGQIVLAVGGVLLLVGIWLGSWKGADAFGEVSSVCVFALILLGTGWTQLAAAGGKLDQGKVFEKLAAKSLVIQWVLLVVGTLFVMVGEAGILLAYGERIPLLGPEILASILLGLLLQGGALAVAHRSGRKIAVPILAAIAVLTCLVALIPIGVMMLFSRSEENKLTAAQLRLQALAVGGLAGFIIALTAGLRLWVSSDEVLFGGFGAWRGPQAWSLWLCIYSGLFGLALMFGSLLLARADVRTQVSMRRMLYGFNAVFTTLLMLAFLVVGNIVIYAMFPMTLQWNASRGLYGLSPQTVDILRQLEKPTKVYVLLSNPPLLKETRLVLNNCQTVTDKLEVKYISPDKQLDAFKLVADRYPELKATSQTSELTTSRGLLVVYGVEPESAAEKQPPHAFIPYTELVKKSRRQRTETVVYNGEKVLMTELRFLMQGREKTTIYFLQGQGELGLREPKEGDPIVGLSKLPMTQWIENLKEQNFNVYGLSFDEGKDDGLIKHVKPAKKGRQKEVPQDADLVVIAGPTQKFSKETLDALERYMDRKSGRILALLEPTATKESEGRIVKTGLEPFFKNFNVDVTDKYVLRLPVRRSGAPVQVFATPPLSDNVIAKQFEEKALRFTLARIVTPISKGFNYKAETLLHVIPIRSRQPFVWGEPDMSWMLRGRRQRLAQLITRERYNRLRSDEPLSVAVGVIDSRRAPRMVVVGDAYFVSDPGLQSRFAVYNLDFANSCVDWLIERPGVGISPPEPGVYTLPPETNVIRLLFMPTWLMILTVVGFGVGVWVVRRG